MNGVLYIVGTPIGNLGDLTHRAAETFKAVDFIAAEDTRVTVKLLNYLNIKKPMISYYEHNLAERGEEILTRIENGESGALCSDAGMPAISDPGELLVREAHKRGIRIVPIPAVSAGITALCVSGRDTSRFVFEGFLSTNHHQRTERLAHIKNEEKTQIFYEAPHKLLNTLQDLSITIGGEREITICRELTKLHEEIWPTTIAQALEKYKVNKPRGEFVLVLAGAPVQYKAELTLEQAAQIAICYMQSGESASNAAKLAAMDTAFSKSEIYRFCQNSQNRGVK